MDKQKDIKNLILAAQLVALLAWPAVALAQEPDPPLEVASEEMRLQSGELPAPLPEMPEVINIAAPVLPAINLSAWPSASSRQSELQGYISSRLGELNSRLDQEYAALWSEISRVRVVTNQVKAAVGDPLTVQVQDKDAETYTMAQAAATMTANMNYALGYVRAVTRLGPLGLDLAFILVALGWVIFVQVAEVAAGAFKTLYAILSEGMTKAKDLLEVVRWFVDLILKIVDIIWPF